MSKKSITIDFYQVGINSPAEISFSDYLETLKHESLVDRNVEILSVPYRLQEVHHTNGFWEGDLIKIRMDNLPSKASLDGTVSGLGIEEDEGVGEEAAFLFDPAINILALQKNRYAVTAPRFAAYFKQATEHVGDIILNPVLQLETLERLGKLQEVRKFSVKIAGVDNMDFLKGEGSGCDELASLQDFFKALNIDLTLSMGREPTGLQNAKDAILKMVGFSRETETLKKIEVHGKDEDGESDIIDLIAEKMRESQEIRSEEEVNRTIRYSVRRNKVKSAFDIRKEELYGRFLT